MSESTNEIPNRFDFTQQASEIYAAWEAAGCFNAEVDPKKKPYSIVIPPPNVTGALHLGHALNNTLQDIQIRMHRMQGFATLWMPGTDHAGIATQAVVERRLKEVENKTRHDLGRAKLVERIWQWKAQYESRILGQLKSMGCSCDWRRTRFTLDEPCARAVRATFFDLFSKDLIYRGKRLVNWDTYLQTTVSDDEVTHEVVKGHFWHFRYPVIDPKAGEPQFVTIATTRPETMLGDTAVAVHPDPTTALSKAEGALQEKLAAASSKDQPLIQKQIDDLAERRKTLLPELIMLAKMAGEGRLLQLPLTDRNIPLIVDDWAKPELGSGCVKITPAHDPNDYEVGKRCKLPMINILNNDGTLNAEAGTYQGLTMPKARIKVVDALDALGLLERIEDREIDLAHSDRSKTPIEPYLADQWFVRMGTLAQSAMDAVTSQQVKIYPERYAKSYLDWLGEKRDWPVGRQLWWGHQIPIWSKSFDQIEACESLKKKIDAIPETASGQIRASVEIGSEEDSKTVLHVCIVNDDSGLETKIESLGLVRQEDVLDTWFSSALWPHSTLGWPVKTAELDYFYPTSTLITSRDIITLWVARMVLMGLNNLGKIPFHEVFIHPKILDGYGETMSKSKGNGVDPIDVIDKFGPDALRFGLAWLATDTQDVRMPVQYECPHCQSLVNQTKENRSKPKVTCDKCVKVFSTQWADSEADKALPKAPVVSERFEVARNFINKLWNASRFVMMNLEGFKPIELDCSKLALEDRWILSRLATVTEAVSKGIRDYKYSDAARAIYEFAWDDFCSYYVEMAKPRLLDVATRPIVQRVLAHTLDALLRLLHPIVPFVTEGIWQHLAQISTHRDMTSQLPATQWILSAPWPEVHTSDLDPAIESQFAQFVALLGAIREIRSRQNIAPKESVEFCVRSDVELQALLAPMRPLLQSMAGATVKEWSDHPTLPSVQAHISLERMDVYVDLSKFIDVEAEISRNEKWLQNIVKQIQDKEGKLANESFVARAPAAVVEKERASLVDLANQRESAEAALKNLLKSRN